MPAINGLLPIISSQAVKKEGAQPRSNEPKLPPVKEGEKPENKGSEKDSAAMQLSDKKRFDDALQEKMSARELAENNALERRAESEQQAKDAHKALAVSGNPLPPAGETLPTIVSEEAANNAAFESVEPDQAVANLEILPGQSPEPTNSTLNPAPAVVDEIATTTHKQETANTQPADAQVTSASLVPPLNPMQGQETQQNDPAMHATQTGAEGVQRQEELESAQIISPNATSQADLEGELSEQSQRQPLSVAANEPRPVADQAERVRAWRGLHTQELQTPLTQTARQETVLNSGAQEHSGQFQQFAQSLRLAVKQSDSATVSTGSERSVAGTGANNASAATETLTSWRTETKQAQLPSAAARQGGNATSFAQTMQASNFGQALGEKLGQNAWGESIAQRVTLMAGQKMSSAQIQLDPPELGAMTVKVTVNGDQASVSFQSAHAVVRDALEASFPRLQEMLGQQGLELADAQVSDQSTAQQDSRGSASSAAPNDGLGSEDDGVLQSSQTVHSATGLIDYYA